MNLDTKHCLNWSLQGWSPKLGHKALLNSSWQGWSPNLDTKHCLHSSLQGWSLELGCETFFEFKFTGTVNQLECSTISCGYAINCWNKTRSYPSCASTLQEVHQWISEMRCWAVKPAAFMAEKALPLTGISSLQFKVALLSTMLWPWLTCQLFTYLWILKMNTCSPKIQAECKEESTKIHVKIWPSEFCTAYPAAAFTAASTAFRTSLRLASDTWLMTFPSEVNTGREYWPSGRFCTPP